MADRKDDTTSTGDRTQLFTDRLARSAGDEAAEEVRASLVVIAGEEIGREIELTAGETVVGRGEKAEARVYARSVSRAHARIVQQTEDGRRQFAIHDLGSMNGTLLNNQKITESVLRTGDKIQLGDVVFKFLVQDSLEQQYHRHVHRLIHFDQLTGLMTMDSFRKVLDEAIEGARPGAVFSLAMTDLDGLKRVNDTLGHLAGRRTIATMGALMRAALRPSDRAGLYGGDEGIILFPGSPACEAAEVAETLRARFEDQPFEHNGQPFRVTISQGIAEWPMHGLSAEELIAAADGALYAAKADGRNCVRLAPPPGATLASSQSGD